MNNGTGPTLITNEEAASVQLHEDCGWVDITDVDTNALPVTISLSVRDLKQIAAWVAQRVWEVQRAQR
jgi:hypothetical protein